MVYHSVKSAAEELRISPQFLRSLIEPDDLDGVPVYPQSTVDALRLVLPEYRRQHENRP